MCPFIVCERTVTEAASSSPAKLDLRRVDLRDDDVVRRSDADAVNIKRDFVLLGEGRGVDGQAAVIVAAVGDKKNARERLAALEIEQAAHGVADGGVRLVEGDRVKERRVFRGGARIGGGN